MTDLIGLTDWAWGLGVLGVLCAAGLYAHVKKQTPGGDLLAELSDRIHEGAMAFLRREYTMLAGFVVVVAALLWLALGSGPALACVLGALGSLAAGLGGLETATRANARVAAAAEAAPGRALRIAFLGGSVTGLAVAALGLVGLGALHAAVAAEAVPGTHEFPRFAEIVAGFAAGASSVALCARFGGGIFAAATAIGARLAGSGVGIADDDPRNPAVVAESVGRDVADVAGAGADVFESYVGAVVATIAVAATSPAMAAHRAAAVALPIATVTIGLLASLVGVALLRALERVDPTAALRSVTFAAAALFLAGSYFVVRGLGITFANEAGRIYPAFGPWIAVLAGALVGVATGLVSEYYTSTGPLRRIARASEAGAATNVIAGLAVGMESTAIPAVLVCCAVGVSWFFAGPYGIAMAAVGMVATVGMTMSVGAFGPIADNAGRLGELARLGPEARQRTDSLRALGSRTAAVGKGAAIASAALTALGLLMAYASAVGLPRFVPDVTDDRVIIGLFVGGVLPLFVAALTLTAVGRAAEGMGEEIRRQLREVPGLSDGTGKPDCTRCVEISTRAAFREMIAPAAIAVVAPVAVGGLLGVEALGGLLAGATVTGALLALFMANAGGAWANARRYIEGGALGGKGSDPHSAAVVGGIVGDPFKDAAGPSLAVLVKVIAIVSLVLAPWLLRVHDITLVG